MAVLLFAPDGRPAAVLPRRLSGVLESLPARARRAAKNAISAELYGALVEAGNAKTDEECTALVGDVIDRIEAKGHPHLRRVLGAFGDALGFKRSIQMSRIFNTARPRGN